MPSSSNIFKPLIILYTLVKESISQFLEDKATKLGASLAYYTLFSLPPLLVIIIALGGIFLGEEAIRGELVHQLEDVIGAAAAQFVQNTLSNIQVSQYQGIAAMISIGVVFFSASTIFAEIQSSINIIWGIKAKPNKSIVKFIFNRLAAFLMVLTLGGVLVIGLITSSIINIVEHKLLLVLEIKSLHLIKWANTGILFSVITILFSFIFKMLPDAIIRYKDAFIGALFTAVLFMIGNYFISIYLSQSNLGNAFGAAASVAILMTWVYYSALVLYLGAEFTKIYSEKYGQSIQPNSYSQWIAP